MRKSRFTETQIVKAVKDHEGGRKVADICRELEISSNTFYKWQSKYGGMEASDVKRMKELEEENSRLYRVYKLLKLNKRRKMKRRLPNGPSSLYNNR